jgi:tetratricopeptide (TPR) repeat protein
MKQQENIKVILILTFLFLNLISSQFISPLYSQVVNGNKKATISFLEKIKTFSEFQKILEMNKNIYGNGIETEVFRQEDEKKLLINNLEQKLLINPKARDVLYSLYLLYQDQGDHLTAQKYFQQAKVIDPDIN